MSKRKGSMEGLSSLMPKVYPGREPEEAHAMRIFAAWSRIVSRRIAQNAQPVSLRNGNLTVHTATSAWSNALSLESENLLAKLRSRVRPCKLRRIRFRVGPLPAVGPAQAPQPPRRRLRPLTELPDDVARELARINDDGLRDAVARAAALSLSGAADRD